MEQSFNFLLGFFVGFVTCGLVVLVVYGIAKMRKPTATERLQAEFDEQVEQARINRSELPPVNHERIVRVFKRPEDHTGRLRGVVARTSLTDDGDEAEPTGRFTREQLMAVKG